MEETVEMRLPLVTIISALLLSTRKGAFSMVFYVLVALKIYSSCAQRSLNTLLNTFRYAARCQYFVGLQQVH